MIDIPRIKFSSPGFVPTPGRTGRRRDAAAAALASKTKGTARMGGGSGWDPQITRLPFLGSTPDGLGHRNGPLVGGVSKQHHIFYVWNPQARTVLESKPGRDF